MFFQAKNNMECEEENWQICVNRLTDPKPKALPQERKLDSVSYFSTYKNINNSYMFLTKKKTVVVF